jgi:nicotinamidase-related amidase
MKGFGERILAEIQERLKNMPVLSFDDFDKEDTALVIVDMVNGFAKEGLLSSPRIRSIIDPITGLLKKFKEKDMTVIAFADAHKPDSIELTNFPEHCIAGTYESEVVEELQSIGGYTLFPKNSVNGFLEDAFLEWYGRHDRIKNWIVTGDCTDICILNFALTLKNDRNRRNKESRVIVPLSMVETYDGEGHNAEFMNLSAAAIMLNQGIEIVKNIE